jgi:hypothetical protein
MRLRAYHLLEFAGCSTGGWTITQLAGQSD